MSDGKGAQVDMLDSHPRCCRFRWPVNKARVPLKNQGGKHSQDFIAGADARID